MTKVTLKCIIVNYIPLYKINKYLYLKIKLNKFWYDKTKYKHIIMSIFYNYI